MSKDQEKWVHQSFTRSLARFKDFFRQGDDYSCWILSEKIGLSRISLENEDTLTIKPINLDEKDYKDCLEINYQLQNRELHELKWLLGRRVGHDFANPLTALIMNQEFAKGELTQAQEMLDIKENTILDNILQLFSSITSSTNKMKDLIDIYRDYEIPAHKISNPNISGNFIKSIYLLTKHYLTENSCLFIEIAPAILNSATNINELRILKYLLQNAVEAQSFKQIDPTDNSNEGIHLVYLTMFDDGEKRIIHIDDTGEKIDENYSHKLFKPMYTTKTDHLGIGLPIVEKLVQDQNGSIDVNSNGWKFTMKFPKRK